MCACVCVGTKKENENVVVVVVVFWITTRNRVAIVVVVVVSVFQRRRRDPPTCKIAIVAFLLPIIAGYHWARCWLLVAVGWKHLQGAGSIRRSLEATPSPVWSGAVRCGRS